MKWRIYYSDPRGRVYDGNCAEHAYHAPSFGVQVLKDECRKEVDLKLYTLRKGCSFYCWEDKPVQRWSGKDDDAGLHDYFHYHRGPQKIIWGREIFDEIFQRVMQKARQDGNFEQMDFQPGKLHRG